MPRPARRTRVRAAACFLLAAALLSTPARSLAEEPAPKPDGGAAAQTTPEAPPEQEPATPAPGEEAAPSEEPGEVQPSTPLSDFVVPVEEIEKTATRSERNVLDVPGNITKITREKILESGARDVPELLRREAGVFVTNTTTNREGYTVEMRGFNNGGGNGSSTLVLIDGRRVNEPSSTVPDWVFIPLDNIESIEVSRGPASALYGDNAVAGVIEIHTLHPEKGLRAILHGHTGTFDTNGGSAWIGGGAGPVTASAFYDGYPTDGYREHSALHGNRGQMDVQVDLLGHGTLGIRGGYDSNDRQQPGTLTMEEIADDRRQAGPGSENNFHQARERFGQAWLDLDITEEVHFHLDGYQRVRDDSSSDSDPFFSFDAKNESDAAAANGQIEWDHDFWGHRSRALLGGDWLQEDVDTDSVFTSFTPGFPPFVSPQDTAGRRRLTGLYFQEELNLCESLILSAGVRHDTIRYRGADSFSPGRDFRQDFEETSPKAALIWRVAEPVSLYASYSRGFRFPNLDEAFGIFGFSPMLVPQTDDAFEVGAKLRTKRAAANLAFYDMDVEHEIFFNPLLPDPFIPGVFGVNGNLDRVRHRGIELSGDVRPLEWLELYGSYTFDDVEIQDDPATDLSEKKMPITPQNRGTVGFLVHAPYGFEVGLNANYVGSRFATNDVNNVLKLPSYATYDARVAWRHPLPYGFSVLVEGMAYNVANRHYVEAGGFSTLSPRVAFFPAARRNYLASLRIEYKL